MSKREKIEITIGIIAVIFFGASGSYVLDKWMTPFFENAAFAQEMEQPALNYHISENMPVGIVISEPVDLGGGVYLIHIEVGSAEKPTIYPAVTAHPQMFQVGSQASFKNVTASGTNAFHDMFHVAVKL